MSIRATNASFLLQKTVLFITEKTVKGDIKWIMEKLVASDRTEGVAIGIRLGIIHLQFPIPQKVQELR
jgi:hypothetical protein